MQYNGFVKALALIFIFSQPLYAEENPPRKTIKEIVAMAKTYCGACHNAPSPSLLPKKSWPYVIEKMVELAKKNINEDYITHEQVKDITAYYYGSSPESLPQLPDNHDQDKSFEKHLLKTTAGIPLVVNITSVNLFKEGNDEFLICDGEKNQVSLLTKTKGHWQETILADIKLATKTQVIDYDSDGDNDIIVAALGLLFPASGEYGGKIYLLRQNDSGTFDKEIILENVGRVTDAQVLDIDGDKDLDIAVSIFGADVHGELAWLENIGNGKHVKHTLLNASGGLNIFPIDLNNDGLIDFVSLVSQQHELVAGLINNGKGGFIRTRLFTAPHPLVGFTGMRLVDLDGDNDIDLLLSNGDANDLQMDPKPYHGVQWLENKGNLQFVYHDIGRFYGAVTAVPGDMDADGDLDIVASSWNNYWEDPKRQSLIWFENDGRQNFKRHDISPEPKSITTFVLEDITNDGLLDIITGVFRLDLLRKTFDSDSTSSSNADNDTNKVSDNLKNEDLLKTRIILFENNKSTKLLSQKQ